MPGSAMSVALSLPTHSDAAGPSNGPADVASVRQQTGGRPVKHALIQLIESRGGWDEAVFDHIADGKTLQEVASYFRIRRADGLTRPISRSFLSHILNDNEELEARLKVARRRGAAALAEQALGIADDAKPERDHVAKARLQVDTRMQLAAAFDRSTFGKPEVGVNVNMNFGDVYLDALRHREVPAAGASESLPVKEAEIIHGDE